ncbi:MAG TPA: hypothetical protein VHL59_13335, partial [Thermoanaerobaculia bacterium]|nr:hypothetical protein [Thermoanaerobaculia bacterium]
MRHLLWPLERGGEAIEAVARGTRWIGSAARELPRYDGSAAEGWIAACATFLRVDAEPVILGYATLEESLRSLGPSLVVVEGAVLAVVRTTARHAIAIAPDGMRARVPLRELAAILSAPVEARFAAEADRALASIGTAAARRARSLLLREFAGDAPIGGIWILRAPTDAVAGHVREGRIVPGILAFGASQIAQTALLMASWWILGAIAFGNAGDAGLFLVWLLVSLTMLPIRFLGTAAGRGATLETGSLLKRRLLAGALKLEPDEVHGHGIGAFMAHVLESAAVENLGSHGATIAVTAVATALGTIVTLALGAGGLAHAALFVLWMAVCGAVTVRYYRARSGWTEARFALT